MKIKLCIDYDKWFILLYYSFLFNFLFLPVRNPKIDSMSFWNIPNLLKREPRELAMHMSVGKQNKGLFWGTKRSRYRCLREKCMKRELKIWILLVYRFKMLLVKKKKTINYYFFLTRKRSSDLHKEFSIYCFLIGKSKQNKINIHEGITQNNNNKVWIQHSNKVNSWIGMNQNTRILIQAGTKTELLNIFPQ